MGIVSLALLASFGAVLAWWIVSEVVLYLGHKRDRHDRSP
jgi:hypothetical protein